MAGGQVRTCWFDLGRDEGLRDIVDDQDIIIHAAGRNEGPLTSTPELARDNVRASDALVGAAIATGCRRIINFSSMSVYGLVNTSLVDEMTPSIGPTHYGASKLSTEKTLRHAAPLLDSISLRSPGIVGPGAHGNWLLRCRATLRSGASLEIANPHFQFNNVIHVVDLAAFIVALCDQDWSGTWTFPIGAGAPMSVLDLVTEMKVVMESTSSISIKNDSRAPFAISSDLAIREFGYLPVSVREIIHRFAVDD
jgi:nucleoside-diphosphate-sugar epimerase